MITKIIKTTLNWALIILERNFINNPFQFKMWIQCSFRKFKFRKWICDFSFRSICFKTRVQWITLAVHPLNWNSNDHISIKSHKLSLQYFISQFNSNFRNFCCKPYTELCFVAEFQWPKGMKLIIFSLRLQIPVFIFEWYITVMYINGCNLHSFT